MSDGARPYPRSYPLGWADEPGDSTEPGRLPTLDEFRKIRLERCRHMLAASRTKSLASAVYSEFGDACRPVLASKGLTIRPDGTVHSLAEQEVDDDWRQIVAAMHKVHGDALPLPCDTSIDAATGCVVVVASSHDHDA